MLVQAGLCRTCSETTLLVFPRGGSNTSILVLQKLYMEEVQGLFSGEVVRDFLIFLAKNWSNDHLRLNERFFLLILKARINCSKTQPCGGSYQAPESYMSMNSFSCSCADPEGGTGGPDPPWNLKILPKKGNFGIFGGLDPPSSVTKNYHFRWTPSHENFWIRACCFCFHYSDYPPLAHHLLSSFNLNILINYQSARKIC